MFITALRRRLHFRTETFVVRLSVAALLAVGIGWMQTAVSGEPSVEAGIRPTQISVDGAAQLQITVRGDGSAEPDLPAVDGLTFTPIERLRSDESINGATSTSLTNTYRVTATRPGRYTIPAMQFGNADTRALELLVLPAGATTGSGAAGAPLPARAFGANAPAATGSPASYEGRDAFVRLLVPKKALYVGELMRVEIKAYFRSDIGVDLNAPPAVQSDAFTVSNLTAEPKQSQEEIGGVPYTVVSWFAALTPIRDGDFPLPAKLAVTLHLQDRLSASGLADQASDADGFDSSFFSNSGIASLLGRGVEKPVTLESFATTVRVAPLPLAGRPASFTGAVGSFEVNTEVTATKVAQGDPLTLRLRVRGQGNFDRVNSSEVASDADWKAYRPGSTFSPADSVGLSGIKTFDQAVVALKAGSLRLPSLDFSYFDPRLRQYVTRQTAAIGIDVSPEQAIAGRSGGSIATAASSVGVAAAARRHAAMEPAMMSASRFVSSLSPVVQRPWFFVFPSFPLAVMAGGLLYFRRRDRLAGDFTSAAGAAADLALAAALADVDVAFRSGDGGAFMMAVRRTLQVRLGQLWGLAPADVGLPELNSRFDSRWDDLRDLFSATDQSVYGGARPGPGLLDRWREILQNQLARLEQI